MCQSTSASESNPDNYEGDLISEKVELPEKIVSFNY